MGPLPTVKAERSPNSLAVGVTLKTYIYKILDCVRHATSEGFQHWTVWTVWGLYQSWITVSGDRVYIYYSSAWKIITSW